MTNISKLHLFLIVLLLGFLTGPRVIEALSRKYDSQTENKALSAQIAKAERTEIGLKPKGVRTAAREDAFDKLELEANGVFVWDINAHKKLYGKNEYEELPLASVTKMMMALVATELLPRDSKVTIAPIDLLEEGDSGLYVGETWKLSDLLKFTLIASSNDGASAIASVAGATLMHASSSDPLSNKKLFIKKMNDKAKDIGLMNTHFENESGLDIASVASGAHGSARDMAILFEYIYRKHPELLSPTTNAKMDLTSENKIVHRVANTNEGVERVAGIIGSKTGYTDIAGGNLVVIVDIGIDHPVAIAALGSTRDGRFKDVEALIGATVETITRTP